MSIYAIYSSICCIDDDYIRLIECMIVGHMARRRTLQFPGSAGIKPLPMIGFKISAKIPLS